ncbi:MULTISPECIES: Yip1 family protein [Priestia]|uniref:Yip1 domain protein n=1 Tax=Priestia megaterium Q3 TaxID=1452722 RepID=A0A806TCT3_PRIMG|nr:MULTISPECIES: Yip1 family protein [Priestia]NHH93673.1 Membrane protein YknW [Bacillus sp. MB95]AKP75791.1 Yip1 domain protein [Priestia megaterium Q3]MBY0076188.1 YIP1 family protein [Priestia aryabhattai]MCM2974713.1 YIP1 family protein [Priestia aryabhattai]MED3887130.1 Yip1 family protein [Priestia aryabhattai]
MSTEVNVSSEVQEKGKPSIFGFITSPVVQFEKMKSTPVIWGPLLLVIVLTLATTLLAVYTPQAQETLQQQKEAGIEVNPIFSMIGGTVGGVIAIVATLAFTSLILFLIAKLGTGKTTYRQMFSMNLFVTFITAIGQLINTGVAALAHTSANVTSLNGLVGAKGAIGGVFTSIEIFSIWGLILTAVGLQKVANLSKAASIITVIVLFILGAAISGVGGAASEALKGAGL